MKGLWREDTWVRPYLLRYGKALMLAIVLSVAASAFACALMFTSGYMISLAAAVPLTVLALHVPSLFVRIFGIGKPLLRYGERLSSHDWALRMTSEMRRKLYGLLERQTSALGAGAGQTTLGQVLALLTDDIGHVQNIILRSVLPLTSAWLLALIVVVACGLLSWRLLAIMLITLTVIAVAIPLWAGAANAARMAAAKRAQARAYDGLTDDIFGLADWVLSGRREDYLHRLDTQFTEKATAEGAVRAFERRMTVIAQIVFCLCVVAVLSWAASAFGPSATASGAIGAIASLSSENAPAYGPNWIAAFVLCLFPLMEALAPLPDAAISYTGQKEALAHLNAQSRMAGAASHETGEAPTADASHATHAADTAPDTPAGVPLPVAPEVHLDDVTFSYDAGHPVLQKVSLSIPFGERIAITGPSGAGKTTLAKLIHGDLSPQCGSVTVGDRSAASYGDSMWRTVGVLHQTPKLFTMTLRENLSIGNPDATDEQMLEALQSVGLTNRFIAMDRGLDTLVQEGAFNLSGGEAHRVALARLLLADQPIVILDEPFASLDEQTEQLVLEAALAALDGKTVIAITHSAATLSAFDRVVELQHL